MQGQCLVQIYLAYIEIRGKGVIGRGIVTIGRVIVTLVKVIVPIVTIMPIVSTDCTTLKTLTPLQPYNLK